MATATDRHEHEQSSLEPDPDALTERSQRWILPSVWWWNRPENWRLVVKPYVLATWIMLVVATLALDASWWLAVLLTAGVPFVLLGLGERFIRNAVAKRRTTAMLACKRSSAKSEDATTGAARAPEQPGEPTDSSAAQRR